MQRRETPSPPADILVTGHFQEEYGYAVYRPRGSGNWLMTYTVRGRGLYRQPGMQTWAEPGDLVLLQPDALHDYSVPPDGAWEFLWAHFQPRASWLSWWLLPEAGKGLFIAHLRTPHIRERVYHAFLRLHTDSALPQGFWPSLTSAATASTQPGTTHIPPHQTTSEPLSLLQRNLALNGLEELLLLTVREQQSATQAFDPRVQTVLDLITRELATQYSVEELAQRVALSPSRLAHLFKQQVGDSIQHVSLSIRLHRAARLLEYRTQSVSTIASEVGFSSGLYLSRQFRQQFGVSPRDYRVQHSPTEQTEQ